MSDEKNTEKSVSLSDQLSSSIYQFATLYELWKKDKAEFKKIVRQLESQNEQLEAVLGKFSTIDEDFKHNLRKLLEREVTHMGTRLGEEIGGASAKAAKAALDETTQTFRAEIKTARDNVKEVSRFFSLLDKWHIVAIVVFVLLSSMLGATLYHFLTRNNRLTQDEAILLHRGAVLEAARPYLSQEEIDTIYGVAEKGKDYVRPKKTGAVPKKVKKSADQG